MTPLPEKCKMVVFINKDREVGGYATNVAPEVEIVQTRNLETFKEATKGMPFVVEYACTD
jgi:hypothetical protein